MIPIKNKDGIAGMREACRVAATVLARMRALAVPGISTYDLDQEAKRSSSHSEPAVPASTIAPVAANAPIPHTPVSR